VNVAYDPVAGKDLFAHANEQSLYRGTMGRDLLDLRPTSVSDCDFIHFSSRGQEGQAYE
jgi:hypothetical protein